MPWLPADFPHQYCNLYRAALAGTRIGISSERKYYNKRLLAWIKATFAPYPDVDTAALRTAIDTLYPAADVWNFVGYESAARALLMMDADALTLCPAMKAAMGMSSSMEVRAPSLVDSHSQALANHYPLEGFSANDPLKFGIF